MAGATTEIIATAARLARGRAGSRRFFRESADNVRLDPQGKLAYVGYGDGALAVIDPQQMKKIGDVKLDGHPEAFQLEQNGPRIIVNVPTAHQAAVVYRERMTVVTKWEVKAAASNLPMALDEGNRRLFIGCRNLATLIVLDIDAGKSVASVDCCGDTDDLFYDRHVKRLYITGGAGCITAIHQTDADHYRTLGNVRTASGTRTTYFDSDSHVLYVGVPQRPGQLAAVRVYNRCIAIEETTNALNCGWDVAHSISQERRSVRKRSPHIATPAAFAAFSMVRRT